MLLEQPCQSPSIGEEGYRRRRARQACLALNKLSRLLDSEFMGLNSSSHGERAPCTKAVLLPGSTPTRGSVLHITSLTLFLSRIKRAESQKNSLEVREDQAGG